MKSKQETFDYVAEFLLKQGGPCYKYDDEGDRRCLYRNSNGMKCAAGCLIPDDKYIPEMDNITIDDAILCDDPMIADILKEEGHSVAFVKCLQEIHDCNCNEWYNWKSEMIEFAKENNLSTKVFEIKDNL